MNQKDHLLKWRWRYSHEIWQHNCHHKLLSDSIRRPSVTTRILQPIYRIQ